MERRCACHTTDHTQKHKILQYGHQILRLLRLKKFNFSIQIKTAFETLKLITSLSLISFRG
jgi:hypothetical protein